MEIFIFFIVLIFRPFFLLDVFFHPRELLTLRKSFSVLSNIELNPTPYPTWNSLCELEKCKNVTHTG